MRRLFIETLKQELKSVVMEIYELEPKINSKTENG